MRQSGSRRVVGASCDSSSDKLRRAAPAAQRAFNHSSVRARFARSPGSMKYSRTLESTKKPSPAPMDFLEAHALRSTRSSRWLTRFPAIKGLPILVRQSHLTFEHFAHEPGYRRILLRRLTSDPESCLVRDLDRDILCHGNSVYEISAASSTELASGRCRDYDVTTQLATPGPEDLA